MNKEEVLKKLRHNPEQTVPRSMKLLKKCMEAWCLDDNPPFSPQELYQTCVDLAAQNGKNAFMRAVICLCREQKPYADKFAFLVEKEPQAPWCRELSCRLKI